MNTTPEIAAIETFVRSDDVRSAVAAQIARNMARRPERAIDNTEAFLSAIRDGRHIQGGVKATALASGLGYAQRLAEGTGSEFETIADMVDLYLVGTAVKYAF